MAQISGQAGANLSQELANYLSTQQGNLTSEQLTGIINSYLTGGDKLISQGGSISTGIYKRFGEFDQVTGKVEVVTTGLWSGDTGSLNSYFTSSTQVAASSGDYYAIVTLMGCSSDTSNSINVISTGIKTVENTIEIKIFPNPVSSELIIDLKGNREMLNLEILNSSGQLMLKDQMTSRKLIQTDDFSKGIYFIKLEGKDIFQVKKIVKN